MFKYYLNTKKFKLAFNLLEQFPSVKKIKSFVNEIKLNAKILQKFKFASKIAEMIIEELKKRSKDNMKSLQEQISRGSFNRNLGGTIFKVDYAKLLY